MASKTVFIDTNGFIQFFDLTQLRWRDLFPAADEINVVVSSTVVDELDSHKISTNQRRRNRARSALNLIEEVSQSPGMTLRIRNQNPVVSLMIYQGPKPDWDKLPQLDSSQPDDRLVAEALTHGDGAAVLTNDTGPRIRARLVGLLAHAPPESFLLPPEKTDDQIKIRSLERDLAQARNASPKLAVAFNNENAEVEFATINLPPLSEDVVDRLVERYLSQNPKSELRVPPPNSMDQLLMRQMGYLDRDIERYDTSYADFEQKIQPFFANLHELIAAQGALKYVPYSVSNIGNISARDMKCEIVLTGDFTLLRSRNDALSWATSLKPPEIPTPPKMRDLGIGRYRDRMNDFSSLDMRAPNLAQLAKPRDPTEMVRFRGPDEEGETFGCADFRPDRTYEDELCLYGGGTGLAKGEAKIFVDAEHYATISAVITISERAVAREWGDVGAEPFIPRRLKALLEEEFF